MSYPVSARARLSSCNPVDASQQEDIYNYHQPGPTETGQTQTGWFQPYGMSRAPLNEHWDAEVGQSSLVPPPIPYVGSPTQQPSGGYTSETTANAETNNSIKEGDKVTVSNFYCSHVLHVTEWLFGVRLLNRPGSKDHPASTAWKWRRA